MAAHAAGTKRFFYASSACVYAADKQTDPSITGLREADAYPAMPGDLLRLGETFQRTDVLPFFGRFQAAMTRVARFNNVYGPQGTYATAGSREGARRHLPQGDRGEIERQARD